jgi:hypothetical protein
MIALMKLNYGHITVASFLGWQASPIQVKHFFNKYLEA